VVDKIVVDEAHHSTSDAYRRVLDWSGVLEPSTHRLLLGVTATPQRADGTSLESIYEKISYVYGIRQAISDGWLSRVRGYRISTDTSLADVSKSAGDFVKSELSAAVNTPERNQRVVDVWKKLAPGKRTLAFAVDIQHAQDLAKKFEDSGVAAEAVWGDDPQRQEKIARHRSGATTVLCNCALVIEGYDDPAIEVVLLTRPTASHVLYSQMIGRMTRLFKGKEYGLAIDFVDATRDFSLVTLPTLMGLQNTLDLQGQDLLDAVETLEALQAEHPTVDFSKLDLLSNAAQVIEQVDLMEVRFPPEVEANSHLVWFKAIDGGYKMLIPKEGEGKTGYVRVFEDMLGQWQLVGTINGDDFHGKRTTIEDVFKVADEQIRARVNKVTIQYLLREATWHNNPVTNGQKQLLTRLFPKRQFPWPQMSSGQASKMINERLARRA
jgi:type I site-specific restriction endonuclease